MLWEFPGGKIEPGETGEQSIIRECQEELDVTPSVEQKLIEVVYEYPDRIVQLHFYLCKITTGIPNKKEHNALAWITLDEIEKYEFCPADKEMLSKTHAQLVEFINV